jgi:hypothetical protein
MRQASGKSGGVDSSGAAPTDAGSPGAASAARRRRRISLATLVGVVTLATGILTLRDQIFGTGGSGNPGPSPSERRIPSFSGTVGHLGASADFLNFLADKDGRVVRLNVAFPLVTTFDTDPPDGPPWVNIYHQPCVNRPPKGVEPGLGDCLAAHIYVLGEKPSLPSRLYYSGGLRLVGYFAVTSRSQEMHQGEVPLGLEALSFRQASAAS